MFAQVGSVYLNWNKSCFQQVSSRILSKNGRTRKLIFPT
ncbi:hypothetical protein OESDEN_18356 [Oesophagostomum dentatum]|uniref:Uncharacterized protein n=1 Tax=Oesophagostomum dentatum TaxID=61180 RepID=A0A0B1SAK1_OESDE|nr:hypothetical protein OESDEN_18356 [Oesophagostomum dentatum]